MGRQSHAEKCEAGDERNALHFLNDRFHRPARGQISQTYGEASTKIRPTQPWSRGEDSGWRDSNPRPVAAATVLLRQRIQFVSATSGFVIQFPVHRSGPGREALAVDESPRDAMPCRFRMTSIMPAQSVVDVFAGADVPPARLRATQNVHVKHGLEVKSGWRDSNPRPLEPHSSVLPS